MIILMAARPFLLLSTDPIIAWTVNGGSTPTTEPITLVKGDAAVRVGALTVRIMCVAPDPPTIAPYVTVSLWYPLYAPSCGQPAMSIGQNLSQVSSPIHGGS